MQKSRSKEKGSREFPEPTQSPPRARLQSPQPGTSTSGKVKPKKKKNFFLLQIRKTIGLSTKKPKGNNLAAKIRNTNLICHFVVFIFTQVGI